MSPAARTAAILAAITFAVFSPTLSSDFVYDARLQILTDPFPHDPRNWPAVLSFAVLGMDVLDFNRPVHLASIMLDAAIWGREPFGYHLTSILLHCANVVLLWLVLRDVLPRGRRAAPTGLPPETGRVTAAGIAAFAGALLFAVHPIVTEAVCEPTFREDVLVATFTLGAIVLASRGGGAGGRAEAHGERDERPSGVSRLPPGESLTTKVPSPSTQPWRAVGCAVLCLLACGSKESGVAAPFVLAAYWWFFRRGENLRFWASAVGGAVALSAAFVAARFLLEPAESVIFEKPSYIEGSFFNAMQIEPRILALYAQLVVCPVNLCADYGGPSIAHLPLWLSLILLVVLAFGLTAAGWRDRRIAFGTALMVLPLVPVSNLVPIYHAAADRYLYVPLTGVAIIAACFMASVWAWIGLERRPIAVLAGIVLLGVLGWACVVRQRVWSNSLALWTDTLTRNWASYSAANGLAGACREARIFVESEQRARQAIALSGGGRGDYWVSLALALDGQGRKEEADAALTQALERDPPLADPDGKVKALAMDLPEAAALKKLLARRSRTPAEKAPAEP